MVSRSSGRPRALVVDDEPTIRDLVCTFLGMLGFEADAVASGPEALTLFGQMRYDLVTTDLVMPGMTGWEVAETIRRQAPEVPIILNSGTMSNFDEDRVTRLRLTVLSKPFGLEGLERAIAEARDRGRGDGAGRHPGPDRSLEPVPPASRGNPDATLRSGPALEHYRDGLALARQLATQLETAVSSAEALLRERDLLHERYVALDREHRALQETHRALVRAAESASAGLAQMQVEQAAFQHVHQSTTRKLAALQGEYEALVRQGQSVCDAIETIGRHLRGEPAATPAPAHPPGR